MVWDDFEKIEKEIEAMRRKLDKLTEFMFKPIKTIRWGVKEFPIDLKEINNKLIIEAELPGVPKENIEVNLTSDRIIIKAEAKKELREEKEGYLHRERQYTKFHRSLSLPVEVIPEKAKASYKDGILKIEVMKKGAKEKKGIKLKIS